MKRVLQIVLITIGALVVVGMIGAALQKEPADRNKKSSNVTAVDNRADSTVSGVDNPIQNGSQTSWSYSDEEDKMTSKPIKYATVEANEQLDLKFPYNGGVTAMIMIRRKNGENNAILEITKGQFMPGVDGENIMVRFDDAKAEQYYCTGSSDGDDRFLFISSASRFISKLKKANKVLIEAEFFDNGNHVMEFNTLGFTWPHS